MKKQQVFNIKGMTKDISRSKSGSSLAYDIQNMRLTSQEGETLLSLTNEKGNKEYILNFKSFADSIIRSKITNANNLAISEAKHTFRGKIIGYCVLDKYLVIFTHYTDNNTTTDRIYRFEKDDTNDIQLNGVLLYWGNLGFTDTMRLETMGIYESANIQKVYWLDGINQPRFINVAGDTETILKHRDHWLSSKTPFDFIPVFDYKGDSSINIERQDYGGTFPEGTIQYAMCYYNLNGQQSNIFYISPIYYISHSDRGAQQEQTLNNSFKITIKNIDTDFDYLRIYSIHRSSINGKPSCKVIANLRITKNNQE